MTALMTVTEQAAEQIKSLLAKSGGDYQGLRIGVRAKGCSGYKYSLEYATAPADDDEIIEAHGAKVFVESGAVLYVVGTEIDFESSTMSKGFIFRNPNEKGRCGCGESFSA